MTQAIAPAPLNAREAFLANSVDSRLGVDVHSLRFFVQMGWTRLNVDSHGVPNRTLLRGEITPCGSFQQKSNLLEIPEGALITGSEERDREGRTVYGRYWRPAWFEAERLLDIEAASERKDGLVEVKALSANPRLYRELDFNEIFFPAGLGALPETNGDMLRHLEGRVAAIAADLVPAVPPYAKRDVLDIGAELITAAKLAQQLQLSRLNYTHSCMKMPPSEEQYKRGYDAVDEEMIVRTGVPRIHEADLKVATAIHTLADNQKRDGGQDAALLAMVEAQREQNAMLKAQMEEYRELVKQLMTERSAPQMEETEAKKPRPKSLVKPDYQADK